MRTTLIHRLVVFLIVTLALSSFATVSSAAAKAILTKKELKVLLRTAKEPAEHRKIADYYRQQAQRLTAESKYHSEMGEIYKNTPLPFEAKHPYGTIGFSHCRYWAELDARQAKEAEALATLHEDMAKAAEQKQP